jgi:hypothetical protein
LRAITLRTALSDILRRLAEQTARAARKAFEVKPTWVSARNAPSSARMIVW